MSRALLPVTRRFIFLEEGDVAEVRRQQRARHRPRRRHGRARRSARASCRPTPPSAALRALHAQGNPRAAARHRRHAAGARGQRAPAGAGLRAGGRASLQARRRTCTSSPAARAITPALVARYWHRADLQDPLRESRSRANTATATRWCRRTRCSSPSRSRARPPTRSPRCVSRKQAGYLSTLAICNVAGELAGARVGARHADACRDRRSASPRPRPSPRSSAALGDAGDRAGAPPQPPMPSASASTGARASSSCRR